MKVIDLSQTINTKMSVFPGSCIPTIEKVASIKKNDYVEHRLTFTTHIGTHIDSPAHVYEDTKVLLDYDVNQFVGEAYVCDVRFLKSITKECIVSIPNLEDIEFILFYCGHGEKFGTESYFDDFPILTEEALSYLLEKGISLKGIGVDSFSIDTVEPVSIRNHYIVLNRGLIIIENLRGLKELLDISFILSVLPLKVSQIEGSPVRAVALLV